MMTSVLPISVWNAAPTLVFAAVMSAPSLPEPDNRGRPFRIAISKDVGGIAIDGERGVRHRELAAILDADRTKPTVGVGHEADVHAVVQPQDSIAHHAERGQGPVVDVGQHQGAKRIHHEERAYSLAAANREMFERRLRIVQRRVERHDRILGGVEEDAIPRLRHARGQPVRGRRVVPHPISSYPMKGNNPLDYPR